MMDEDGGLPMSLGELGDYFVNAHLERGHKAECKRIGELMEYDPSVMTVDDLEVEDEAI